MIFLRIFLSKYWYLLLSDHLQGHRIFPSMGCCLGKSADAHSKLDEEVKNSSSAEVNGDTRVSAVSAKADLDKPEMLGKVGGGASFHATDSESDNSDAFDESGDGIEGRNNAMPYNWETDAMRPHPIFHKLRWSTARHIKRSDAGAQGVFFVRCDQVLFLCILYVFVLLFLCPSCICRLWSLHISPCPFPSLPPFRPQFLHVSFSTLIYHRALLSSKRLKLLVQSSSLHISHVYVV